MVTDKPTPEDSYLSSKQVQNIIPFSPATISRLSKDAESDFPKAHYAGRSIFWKASEILHYLSMKSGISVQADDRAITAKELQAAFGKSHTWLWQNIKKGNLPEPFKINRSCFWLQSQLEALMQNEGGSNA